MVLGYDDGLWHFSPRHTYAKLCSVISLFILATLGNLFLTAPASAQNASDNLVLADGPVSMKELSGDIAYFFDPRWEKTVSDMMGTDADKFRPLDREEPDFGYTKDKIWLKFKVKNTTEIEDEWRLHFRENFKQVIDVYVLREGGQIDHTLNLDRNSKFSERPISFPEMVAPVQFEPGETITVFIAYWSEGSSHLAFSLETSNSFSDIAIARMAKNFIYYGMMVILIIAAFLSMLILKHSVFPAYTAYAVSTLLFLMHADGVAFEYLWPSFPGFNSIASIVLGGALTTTSANYARVFLRTKIHNPVMDKALLAMVILIPLICLSATVLDPQPIKKILIPIAFLAMALCLLSGLVAARTRFREVRFYVLAWVGAVVSSLIMNLRYIAGITLTQDLVFDSIRVAMVFDAAMMGLAIADRFNQMRQARQQALQQSLNDAKRNLELNTRLQGLEQQYDLAAEIALSRDEEMRNTVHDIRQPLHALRLNVKNLIEKGQNPRRDGENIEETFSYLEQLISNQLQDSIEGGNIKEVPPELAPDSHLSVPKVLKSIHEMFLSDARHKNLDFKFMPSNHDANINPLVLMRIVTNLVSNAIKYTESGVIVLASRKKGSVLKIEVADTGIGMSQEQFEEAKQRQVRLGAASDSIDGNGYGLAIAENLAAENDLRIYLSNKGRKGTRIILEISS